jgi:hypothetical protein
MSFHTPAHKQLSGDKTLADYIERKTPEKKLAFDDWWKVNSPYAPGTEIAIRNLCEASWQAAQANK